MNKRAIGDYVQEALQVQKALLQGYICLSASPASADFFVEKKWEGLCPCIDYCGQSQTAVKYPYPLPLVTSALEQLCSATMFTKLDLHSAYNLVYIRHGEEWKTAFSTTFGHCEYCVVAYGLSCLVSCLVSCLCLPVFN